MRTVLIVILFVLGVTVLLYFFGTGLIQNEAGMDVDVSTPATEGPEDPDEQ